jgi:hypothetical protein
MPNKKIDLKLTPIKPKTSIEKLPDLTDLAKSLWMKWRKDKATPYFGSILPLFKSKDYNFKIVEFYPHAAEVDKRKKAFYKTTQEAIEACIGFANAHGYYAERIDLESLLSRAGTRRESF